jgi:hypothetical protein
MVNLFQPNDSLIIKPFAFPAAGCHGMSMSCPGHERRTLHNIKLSLGAGQTLSIVGSNGGGKTTLVKALMGMYDCKGDFAIIGDPRNVIDPRSLHDRASCLFQDFRKYRGVYGTTWESGTFRRWMVSKPFCTQLGWAELTVCLLVYATSTTCLALRVFRVQPTIRPCQRIGVGTR